MKFEELTPEQLDASPEQFDYIVLELTLDVLKYISDKLTPEQFDYFVHEFPRTALKYFADKLSAEQKKYCEERTK